MSEDVSTKEIIPTDRELTVLLQSIKTIRAYGKDIDNEAKKNLIKIVHHLEKSGYKNKALLKQLDNIVKTSQVLMS